MTLKNFYNHKYTKNMLKHHAWIIWMSLLLNGLCTLLPMSLAVTERMQSGTSYGADYILISNIALYIVAAAGGKIAGVGIFKYLNNKSEVDFYHSVPVKKSGLFFSRYMTGVTAYLTGLKLMYFASVILGLATGIIELNQLWPMFITLVLVILTFLGVYSFVVWGTVITGNIFMSMATAFGIMFSPIFFTVIIVNLCDIQLQTFSQSGLTIVDSVFKWTNPCFTALSPLLGYEVGTTAGLIPMFLIWIVATMFAFLSFMKRKSESAGSPVAITAKTINH